MGHADQATQPLLNHVAQALGDKRLWKAQGPGLIAE